eukprot:scpid102888/ scgid0539/ 
MTDDCQQTSDSDNERLTTDDERRTTDSDNERLTTHDDRRTTDDDMAKGKHDIRNWCPRQHKRWCTQHKKVHVSTTKQRSSMYGSATKQRSSMYGSATKQRSSMYGSAAQRHKYSSRYDKETARAATCTTHVSDYDHTERVMSNSTDLCQRTKLIRAMLHISAPKHSFSLGTAMVSLWPDL